MLIKKIRDFVAQFLFTLDANIYHGCSVATDYIIVE